MCVVLWLIVFFGVCCFVVCCALFDLVGGCVLFNICFRIAVLCVLFVACWFAVNRLFFVVACCCSLLLVCCLLLLFLYAVRCFLLVVGCCLLLFVGCCVLIVRSLCVVCRSLCVVWWSLFVECCLLVFGWFWCNVFIVGFCLVVRCVLCLV